MCIQCIVDTHDRGLALRTIDLLERAINAAAEVRHAQLALAGAPALDATAPEFEDMQVRLSTANAAVDSLYQEADALIDEAIAQYGASLSCMYSPPPTQATGSTQIRFDMADTVIIETVFVEGIWIPIQD